MDLPDSTLALEGNLTLPEDLKDDVEAVQISGGPAGLEGELQHLKDLRRVNQELVVQTEELIQKEVGEDAQFRKQFGTRWTRSQSSTLSKNLQDRLNCFAANLKQAADSDSRIERSVRDHYAIMSILDRRPIETALPSLAKPIMSLDANEDAIAGALKQSLRQLEMLGAQRAGLEDMLKEMKLKDAITNIKQQCSDFVMTRNMQCREMVEDVQQQMAGLNFQDRKSSGSGYAPPYGVPHQPSPYHMASTANPPYPPPHTQQPPPGSHEYGQPAYPGWRGPYNPTQQPGPPYPPHQSGYYRQQ